MHKASTSHAHTQACTDPHIWDSTFVTKGLGLHQKVASTGYKSTKKYVLAVSVLCGNTSTRMRTHAHAVTNLIAAIHVGRHRLARDHEGT